MNRELLEKLASLERRIGALERQERPVSSAGGVLSTSAPLTVGDYIRASGVTNPRIRMRELTLAAGASEALGNTSNVFGWVFINSASSATGALFFCRGTVNNALEVLDPTSRFGTSPGTPDSINVYFSVENSRYEVQNGWASTQTIEMMFIAR